MDRAVSYTDRVRHLSGSPFEIGCAAGQSLGPRLEANIERYIRERAPTDGALDAARWQAGALPWLRSLPPRFLEEFEGLAQGAMLPMQWLAEWAYLDTFLSAGCTGAILTIAGRAWVARNNDFCVPDL